MEVFILEVLGATGLGGCRSGCFRRPDLQGRGTRLVLEDRPFCAAIHVVMRDGSPAYRGGRDVMSEARGQW